MAYSAHKDFYFMDGDQGGGFGDNSTICNDTDEESVSSSSTVVLVKQTVKNINSACMIENHIYQSTEYDSDLDSEDNMDFVAAGDNADNHYAECMKIPTKISVATPEQLQKRKEVYEKWLQDVQYRVRERKYLHMEMKRKEENARKQLEEERQRKSEAHVQAWHAKKEAEAKEKLARVKSQVKTTTIPVKDLKKKPSFDSWVRQKEAEAESAKLRKEQDKRLTATKQKCRKSLSKVSYDRWTESAQAKDKPVPLNRGIETLQGSVSQIFVNPLPWSSSSEDLSS